MASERAGLQTEGALYELLSRGNKDTFFWKANDEAALNPFETRYKRRPGALSEVRRIPPLNVPEFGRSCEFEFEIAGDLFLDTVLVVDLPSWLPPVEAALNSQSGVSIAATGSGRTYGYTRGIGYFLFSKVQLYQDKILLQEFSGDALWASRLSSGSLNSAYLDQAVTGMTDVSGSPASLARNATPGRLRLHLPMLGGRRGVPSLGMRQQTFRLRLHLRPLTDVIECSDPAVTHPAPWTEQSFSITDPSGATYTIAPLPREQIAAPTLQLETRHVYLDPESRAALEKQPHELPYRLLYENDLTFGGLDYQTASAAPTFTRDLDARHPARRLFWMLRTRDDLQRGRRWATSGAENPYYSALSLLIAGRDREALWDPIVWGTLTPFAKEERDPGFALGTMNWGLGAVAGRPVPSEPVPEGSVNFSTAEKPVVQIQLRAPNADQPFDTKRVDMTAVLESWSLYTVEGGRGALKYGN